MPASYPIECGNTTAYSTPLEDGKSVLLNGFNDLLSLMCDIYCVPVKDTDVWFAVTARGDRRLAVKKNELVLVADPDVAVQSAMTKLFSEGHSISCVSDSDSALKFIKERPAVAVIFSCFHLPGSGGVAFLKDCSTLVPQAARIMLTREGSKEAIKQAVNEGHAFMYLEKPCNRGDIVSALDAGLAHHRLMAKERMLLERTLAGSVKMLIEMLALFHPDAFRRTSTMRVQATKLAKGLGIKKTWELEMAVMLSPLGEAMLPKHILSRYRAARSLGDQERDILSKAPQQTRDLLQNIPQLDRVAEYLYLSGRGYDGSGFPENGPQGDEIPIVSRIIKLLTDLWYASPENGPDAAAFEALGINARQYDPRLLDVARETLLVVVPEKRGGLVLQCYIRSLRPGDVLVDDVRTETSYELVLSSGHLLTPTTIRRLEHFNKTAGVRQPIRVERKKTAEQDAGQMA